MTKTNFFMTIFYKAKFLVLSLFNIKYQTSSVEFFSIGKKFQFKWIENNIPDYDDFSEGSALHMRSKKLIR